MSSGEIILLTGDLLSGKTNFCLEIAQKAKDKRIDVAGIISPAVFTGSNKTAIDALDLRTWNRKRLAELRQGEKTDLETRRWSFDSAVVNWGNQVLMDAVPCDLLIIDELGPLEFTKSEGWIEGFSAIESREYQVAIVVIRPSLVSTAAGRWKISREIDLDSLDPSFSKVEDFFSEFELIGKKGS
jgi:nucleoside-triphosphatase THEP1